MKRRGFLQRVLGVGAAAVAVPVAAKAAEVVGEIERKPVELGEPTVPAAMQHPVGRFEDIYATCVSASIGFSYFYESDD